MPAASLVIADRVLETSNSTGAGSITLNGPAFGFRSFYSIVGVGNSTYYCITNTTTGEWEVGLGTLINSTTFARDMVFSSSNSDLLVGFSAGGLQVFCTYPAKKSIYTDTSGVPVQFGNHLSTGSGSITGYIEVKDNTGAVRKLAVIA